MGQANRTDTDEIVRPTRERMAKAIADEGERCAETIVIEITNNTGKSESASVIRITDSPLGKLALRKHPKITPEQYSAGERYLTDAYHAGLMQNGVVDTTKERVDGGNYKDISDFVIAARQRHNSALRILDHIDVNILHHVVLEEKDIAHYRPPRITYKLRQRDRIFIAIDRLCLALDKLDRHYCPPRRDKA
jgi:hypothetical protein